LVFVLLICGGGGKGAGQGETPPPKQKKITKVVVGLATRKNRGGQKKLVWGVKGGENTKGGGFFFVFVFESCGLR